MIALRNFAGSLLGLWVVVGAANAQEVTVSAIEIQRNEKTLDITILQERSYRAGGTATQEALDRTSQAIKDLGLFQAVNSTVTSNDDSSVSVLITLKEKRYNFILPKLNRNGDGDITTGIVWRTDNLFGRNQQSKFTVAYRKFDDSDEEDETQIKWEFKYPRIRDCARNPYSSFLYHLRHSYTTSVIPAKETVQKKPPPLVTFSLLP